MLRIDYIIHPNFLFANYIQMASSASTPKMSAREEAQALLAKLAVLQAQAEQEEREQQERLEREERERAEQEFQICAQLNSTHSSDATPNPPH